MSGFWVLARGVAAQTALSDISLPSSATLVRLEECPTVYLGAGWFAGCIEQRYLMVNGQRQSYGPEGDYIETISYFRSGVDAVDHFFLPSGKYSFESEIFPFLTDPIVPDVHIDDTWGAVSAHLKKLASSETYYAEWDAKRLVNGQLKTLYQTIHFGPFQLHFYGIGKAARLRAFAYSLTASSNA